MNLGQLDLSCTKQSKGFVYSYQKTFQSKCKVGGKIMIAQQLAQKGAFMNACYNQEPS